LFDLVRLGNLQSAAQNLKGVQAAAMDSRDLIVVAVVGTYLQVTAARARVVATRGAP